MKLERLAFKWAITDKFWDYLIASQFTVYTDNNPLKYIMNTAKLKGVEQKWVVDLGHFNFEIRYRPGNENANPDALSRHPHQDSDDEKTSEEMDFEEVAGILCVTVITEDL